MCLRSKQTLKKKVFDGNWSIGFLINGFNLYSLLFRVPHGIKNFNNFLVLYEVVRFPAPIQRNIHLSVLDSIHRYPITQYLFFSPFMLLSGKDK